MKWICSILSSYKRHTIHPYGRSSAGHLTPWQCIHLFNVVTVHLSIFLKLSKQFKGLYFLKLPNIWAPQFHKICFPHHLWTKNLNTCVEDSALLILNCYAPVLLPLSIQKSRHGSKHYCNVLILQGNSYITSKRSLNIIRFALFKPPNPHDGALIETCL